MSSRWERRILTWTFLLAGLCLLAIAAVGHNRMLSIIDAVLGVGSFTLGCIRARQLRIKKGLRIWF